MLTKLVRSLSQVVLKPVRHIFFFVCGIVLMILRVGLLIYNTLASVKRRIVALAKSAGDIFVGVGDFVYLLFVYGKRHAVAILSFWFIAAYALMTVETRSLLVLIWSAAVAFNGVIATMFVDHLNESVDGRDLDEDRLTVLTTSTEREILRRADRADEMLMNVMTDDEVRRVEDLITLLREELEGGDDPKTEE